LASGAHEVRLSAFALLALANLLWSGNWIAGRALREAFDPITLNFWRWLIAAVVLAPFALPLLRGKAPILRRHALGASVLAYICWNRGVAAVGANAAGIATILAGVLLASRT
jgi:drug/metabolite transporter (DMT)-like permease